MGRPKGALPFRPGVSFLQRGVQLAASERVFVVVGPHNADSVPTGAHSVLNPSPEAGMFSSVQLGLAAALGAKTSAILLHMVDYPGVAPETVEALWRQPLAPGEWVFPIFGEQPGHPIVLSRQRVEEIVSAPADSRLDQLLDETSGIGVTVDDPGIVTNVNTPEAFRKMTGMNLLS
ncbi:MAG: NTP transferase domain-containing protein [Myxococcales bacterium]|nr:NTP transferase domain-containing protein [Myxococcales bacterium]